MKLKTLILVGAISSLLASCCDAATLAVPTGVDAVRVILTTSDTPDGAEITIRNESSGSATITMISFDGEYAQTVSTESYSGTVAVRRDFSANLPGGNPLGWSDSAVFFTAEPPPPKNGIGSSESITFTFTGVSEEELISSDTRIGFHIQSLPDGSSMTAVTTIVPEPKSALLGGLGLLTLFTRRNTKLNAITI